MAKFHINPATGKPGACSAQEGNCPFGSDAPHFATAAEAQSAYEKQMASATLATPAKKPAREFETVIPEPIMERVGMALSGAEVKEGDVVTVNKKDFTVLAVKKGYKYASITVEDPKKGTRNVNLPLDQGYTVSREVETEESKEARSAASREEWYERAAKKPIDRRQRALDSIQDRISKGYTLSGSQLGDLATSEAKDEVMTQYVATVKQLKEEGVPMPYTAATEHLQARYQAEVISQATRGGSVSTSEGTNLLERERMAARADFLRDGPAWL